MSGGRAGRATHMNVDASDGQGYYGYRAPVSEVGGGRQVWGDSSPGDSKGGRWEGGGAVSALTNDVLLDLLERRQHARSIRDFDTSDRIRDEMRKLGVFPDDRSRTWKTDDGRSGSLEGPDFFGPSPGMGGAAAAEVGAGAGNLSDRQICEMLTEREHARMEKDYARADDIRTELNLNGVNTDDRTKTWRCSDGRSGSYTDTRGRMDSTISLGASYFNDRYGRSYNAAGGYNQAATLPPGPGYSSRARDPERYYPRSRSRSPPRRHSYGDGRTTSVDRQQDVRMLELLQKRSEARQLRDWATSDLMRDQLADMGITTDDRAKVWRSRDGRVGRLEGPDFLSPPGYGAATVGYGGDAVGGYGGSVRSYGGGAAGGYGGGGSRRMYLSDAEIHDELVAREQARMAKDFAGADEIRRVLLSAGVTICDRTKSWTAADGRSGGRPDARGNVEPSGYGGRGGNTPYVPASRMDGHRMDAYVSGAGSAGYDRYSSGREQRGGDRNGYGSYSSSRYGRRY